ncbi:MAG: START domain-containing protein [Pseudomonadales bacterium]|jgi:hypothetical protein|nr:START domain-containing protein [Pseudomonadales bacterium]
MTRLATLFILLTASVGASAADWSTRLDQDGVLIESRKTGESKYEEFRAQTLLDVNVASALALLQDTEACTQWVFRCKESITLEQPSATERSFHQVTSLPFPAKSRDVIFHAEISYKPEGTVKVEMTARPDALPEGRHVRIQEAYGFYLLEPVSEDRTKITWQQYVDPAGALPSWLVNSMLTDLPFRSLTAFRELVTKAPYAGSVMVYDPDGLPIDISHEAQ